MSWQANVVHGCIRTAVRFGPKDAKKERRKLDARGRAEGTAPAKLRGINITRSERHGMTVVRLSPLHAAPTATVLYCHGGSYCYPAAGVHWQFLRKLVLETQTTFEVPLYPLAPADTAARTVPAVAAVLADLAPTIVMGDSAGGGLALAVTQLAVRRGMSCVPKRLILIAPWLDVRTADPRQVSMEASDVILTVKALQTAGQYYAGNLATEDPLVSPLLGELRGLPPINVIVGAADLLSVDSHDLARRCQDAGQPIEVIEAPAMQHVFPIMPFLPEARQGRDQIAAWVRST